MEALQQIENAIKSRPDSFSTIQEAVIQFTLLVSKDYKVANINLLKASYSIARTVIQLCGAGPRACKPVIEFCVSKLHDKKIGSDLSELLSCIAERIGPNSVFDTVVCSQTLVTLRFGPSWNPARFPSNKTPFCSFSIPF